MGQNRIRVACGPVKIPRPSGDYHMALGKEAVVRYGPKQRYQGRERSFSVYGNEASSVCEGRSNYG